MSTTIWEHLPEAKEFNIIDITTLSDFKPVGRGAYGVVFKARYAPESAHLDGQ